jgi:carbohydrate-selective porin OprB
LAAPQATAGLVQIEQRLSRAGQVWSQPSAVHQPAAHSNEYGFEVTYVLQLTPLASVQPDLQMIWNPANNFSADRNLIFQLQLNLAW